MSEKTKSINIVLPEKLWHKVGVQSAIEGIDKRILVIKALEEYLIKVKKEV